ncbi:MAG TPA: hypothetical protein VIM70_05240, partial [Clostridium sp.]|uniref:pLS20_p028 family conjugation system transmembrane protein n=1 Tax=Clostridium sp. TaxID=1506 RepID=UPI002F9456F8
MTTVQILQTYSEFFKLDTILGRTIRELLWGIVKVLGYIVDSVSAITDKLFVLDKFYNDPGVIDFINSVKPLIVVLFALSLLGIGYQLMFSQTKQFRKIGTNILVAIAVILVLPMAMDKMNALTNLGVTAVKGSPKDITNQIIKSNITDILLYDQTSFNKDDISGLRSSNNIKIENIRYIDPTSIIEPDFINSGGIKNKEVFGEKLSTNVKGDLSTEKLNQGWLTFWKEYYYRFDINFLNIILSLGVIGATLAFTCFKLAKLIFELAYNKFLAILLAPVDINDGQKTKQIIQNIMSTFIVTFLIAVLLEFYVLFVDLCSDVKGIEGVVLLVAGSFAVIDGPNMVEKLFGIDAGLRSGFKTMAGAYMVGNAVMGGAKSIGKTAKSIGKTANSMAGSAGKMAGSTFGAGAGIASGLYKDMDKDKSKVKKNADANKAKSIYPGMAKDKAKGYEDLNKGNVVNSSTGNSSKKVGTSSPEGNIKGNGSQGHQSIYDEMGNGKSSIKDNGSQGHQSIYDEMNGSSGDNEEGEQPSSNRNVPNNTHESINSSNGTETNGSENNETSGHTVPNNKSEPIRPNNGKSSYQMIRQKQKEKIIKKVQNNPIVKQTMESYNRGKNIGQSIRVEK